MTRTYADGIEDAARVADGAVCIDRYVWNEACRSIAAAIRTLSPSPSGIDDAREALTKAGEAFRMYEQLHAAKIPAADAYDPRSVPEISAKVSRNRELAEMCESASSKIGGDHG